MRRETTESAEAPIRLMEFVRSFHLGGTEGQVVELLRSLPPSYRVQLAVMNFVGPLSEEVAKLGFAPREFPLSSSVMRPQTLFQVARLGAYLRRERVQLLHVHDFYGSVLGVPAAKLAGAKVIVGRLDLAHWHNRIQRAVLKRWTRLADHVIANAEAIRRQLMDEEGIASERITVIHNGLDLARFDERSRAELASPLPDGHGEPWILHVANMNHPVKRQEDLLHALALLQQKDVACQVLFVGNGPRRPELEALAQKLGVAARAHFLGHRSDVPALYSRAFMGVLCSSHEGMSNAVMEGMAAGLPMVVTRVGGSPDLIVDGKRGRVVEPFAPAALAAAIEELLAHPAQAKAMGAAARDFVRRNLSLEAMVQRHDAVYRRVLQA